MTYITHSPTTGFDYVQSTPPAAPSTEETWLTPTTGVVAVYTGAEWRTSATGDRTDVIQSFAEPTLTIDVGSAALTNGLLTTAGQQSSASFTLNSTYGGTGPHGFQFTPNMTMDRVDVTTWAENQAIAGIIQLEDLTAGTVLDSVSVGSLSGASVTLQGEMATGTQYTVTCAPQSGGSWTRAYGSGAAAQATTVADVDGGYAVGATGNAQAINSATFHATTTSGTATITLTESETAPPVALAYPDPTGTVTVAVEDSTGAVLAADVSPGEYIGAIPAIDAASAYRYASTVTGTTVATGAVDEFAVHRRLR